MAPRRNFKVEDLAGCVGCLVLCIWTTILIGMVVGITYVITHW